MFPKTSPSNEPRAVSQHPHDGSAEDGQPNWPSLQTPMSHNTDDTTTLAFCQMMTAKDEQIRRLVLKMANMQQHQTTQKLEHAQELRDAVQKHARLFRRADELAIECRRATEENRHLRQELNKHKAALCDAKTLIDDVRRSPFHAGPGYAPHD